MSRLASTDVSTPPTPEGEAALALRVAHEREDFLRSIAFDVVDKQYRLYSWNDAKTQALIMTDSVLFAAVGFLYKEALNDSLATILLGVGTVCLGLSLMTCLVHVIPRITSGRSGEGPNTRSLRGIHLFSCWEDYRDAFMKTTPTSILTDSIRQVYGMADNNVRSARIIKRGVGLTLCGVIAIVAALFASAASARGYHPLGVWQVGPGAVPIDAPVDAGPRNVVPSASPP